MIKIRMGRSGSPPPPGLCYHALPQLTSHGRLVGGCQWRSPHGRLVGGCQWRSLEQKRSAHSAGRTARIDLGSRIRRGGISVRAATRKPNVVARLKRPPNPPLRPSSMPRWCLWLQADIQSLDIEVCLTPNNGHSTPMSGFAPVSPASALEAGVPTQSPWSQAESVKRLHRHRPAPRRPIAMAAAMQPGTWPAWCMGPV